MSAFGQAGFGSMNRRNQLRAQGQLDPYGQQVRSAMQAPTLNIYQTPAAYQQATGQQQAPRQSQPAVSSPPAPTSPPTTGGSIPASGGASAPQTGGGFPVYGGADEPRLGGVMPTYDEVMRQQSSPGTAQPIPPASQGTPYTSPSAATPQTGGGFPVFDSSSQPQTGGGFPVFDGSSQPQTGGGFPVYGGADEPQTGGGFPVFGSGQATSQPAAIQSPMPRASNDQQNSYVDRPVLPGAMPTPMFTYGKGNNRVRGGTDYIGDFGDGLRTMNIRPTNLTPPTPQSPAGPSPEEAQRNAADHAAQDRWRGEMSRAQLSPAEYAAQQRRLTEFQRSGSRDPYVFAGQASKRPGYDQEMARRFTDRQASQQRWQQEQEEFLRGYSPRTFEEWRSAQR